MPKYDYRCLDCGEKMQVKASITEKESGLQVVCEKCGSSHTEQAFLTMNLVGDTQYGKEFTPSYSGGGCPGGACGIH